MQSSFIFWSWEDWCSCCKRCSKSDHSCVVYALVAKSSILSFGKDMYWPLELTTDYVGLLYSQHLWFTSVWLIWRCVMAKYMNLRHIFYVGFAFCQIECFVIFVENGIAILHLYRLISTSLHKIQWQPSQKMSLLAKFNFFGYNCQNESHGNVIFGMNNCSSCRQSCKFTKWRLFLSLNTRNESDKFKSSL